MFSRRNLWLLRAENVLTAGNATIPLLPLFYYSLGLTQTHLGISEAVFALFLLTFGIPTSWIADRFSHKACNVIGNLMAAASFLVLATATNFAGILMASMLLSLGNASSQGPDVALLHRCCENLKLSFARETALQRAIAPLISIGFVVVGGLLAAYQLKLGLLWGGVPFLIAGIVVFFVKENRDIKQPVKAPEMTLRRQIVAAFIDMRDVTLYCLKNRQLRWIILTRATVTTLTGSIGWLATPLGLRVGLPEKLVVMSWIIFVVTLGLGAWAYRQLLNKWGLRTSIFLPALISIGSMLILSAHISAWTLWLFGLVGLCRGWHFALFMPLLQKETPEGIRATVSSVDGSLTLICYVAFTILINWASSWSIEWALIINSLIILPFVLIAALKMPQCVK